MIVVWVMIVAEQNMLRIIYTESIATFKPNLRVDPRVHSEPQCRAYSIHQLRERARVDGRHGIGDTVRLALSQEQQHHKLKKHADHEVVRSFIDVVRHLCVYSQQ